MTTIGFADVVLKFSGKQVRVWHYDRGAVYRDCDFLWWPCDVGLDSDFPLDVLAEVKIAEVSVGDVIRQIKLYRTYLDVSASVLVAAFDLSQNDIDTLKAERIAYVRLGEKFNAYCVEQESLQAESKLISQRYEV